MTEPPKSPATVPESKVPESKVIDAWALIAWLLDQAAAPAVESLIQKAVSAGLCRWTGSVLN
jgi:hypothetical protein